MNKYRNALKGYNLAMQISGVLLCTTLGSVFGGIWLDRQFNTAPCLILLCTIVGLVLAMVNIIRIARQLS